MKTKSRKLIAFLLIVALLLTTAVIASAANAPTIELSSAKGKAGDEVAIKLSLNNNPGITALSVSISYPAEALDLLAIEDGGLFEDRISTSRLTQNPLTVSWFAADSGNKKDSGVLAVLRFKIKDGAQVSPITIAYDADNIFDSTFRNVTFGIVNGQVTADDKNLLGDADGDGEVTLMDVTEVQRYLSSMKTNASEDMLMFADVDGNGILEIVDATYIQRHLAQMEIPYAVGEAIEV